MTTGVKSGGESPKVMKRTFHGSSLALSSHPTSRMCPNISGVEWPVPPPDVLRSTQRAGLPVGTLLQGHVTHRPTRPLRRKPVGIPAGRLPPFRMQVSCQSYNVCHLVLVWYLLFYNSIFHITSLDRWDRVRIAEGIVAYCVVSSVQEKDEVQKRRWS